MTQLTICYGPEVLTCSPLAPAALLLCAARVLLDVERDEHSLGVLSCRLAARQLVRSMYSYQM